MVSNSLGRNTPQELSARSRHREHFHYRRKSSHAPSHPCQHSPLWGHHHSELHLQKFLVPSVQCAVGVYHIPCALMHLCSFPEHDTVGIIPVVPPCVARAWFFLVSKHYSVVWTYDRVSSSRWGLLRVFLFPNQRFLSIFSSTLSVEEDIHFFWIYA